VRGTGTHSPPNYASAPNSADGDHQFQAFQGLTAQDGQDPLGISGGGDGNNSTNNNRQSIGYGLGNLGGKK